MGKERTEPGKPRAPCSLNHQRRRCGQSEAAALLLALEADVDTQREAPPCKTPRTLEFAGFTSVIDVNAATLGTGSESMSNFRSQGGHCL